MAEAEPVATTDTDPIAALELRDVSVGYEGVPVLERTDIRVMPGEFFVILGPNGSGKSTVLRTAAGLIAPWRGRVDMFGQDVTDIPTRSRDLALIFKGHGLFSQMTVAANVELCLQAAGVDRASVAGRTRDLLQLVRLGDLGGKEVLHLSAGEQQRANLARALATGSRLLLMHEPLADMDADLRVELGDAVRQWQRSAGLTVVMTTRDAQDALRLADRVAVLHQGVIEDLGDPRRVYAHPASVRAATSTGPANILRGVAEEVGADGDRAVVSTGLGDVSCRGSGLRPGDAMTTLIRPENISLHAEPLVGGLAGRVERCSFYGSHWMVDVRVGEEVLEVLALARVGSAQPRPGESVHVLIRDDACVVINDAVH